MDQKELNRYTHDNVKEWTMNVLTEKKTIPLSTREISQLLRSKHKICIKKGSINPILYTWKKQNVVEQVLAMNSPPRWRLISCEQRPILSENPIPLNETKCLKALDEKKCLKAETLWRLAQANKPSFEDEYPVDSWADQILNDIIWTQCFEAAKRGHFVTEFTGEKLFSKIQEQNKLSDDHLCQTQVFEAIERKLNMEGLVTHWEVGDRAFCFLHICWSVPFFSPKSSN